MLTPLVVSQEFGPQVPDRGSPFSFRAGLAFSGTHSCGQQFYWGVIDIVESMSRRVFLTVVCAPPSASFFLTFFDIMLSDFCRLCVDLYVLCDYCLISALLLPCYRILMFDYGIPLFVLTVITLLNLAGWLDPVVVVVVATTHLRRRITWPLWCGSLSWTGNSCRTHGSVPSAEPAWSPPSECCREPARLHPPDTSQTYL